MGNRGRGREITAPVKGVRGSKEALVDTGPLTGVAIQRGIGSSEWRQRGLGSTDSMIIQRVRGGCSHPRSRKTVEGERLRDSWIHRAEDVVVTLNIINPAIGCPIILQKYLFLVTLDVACHAKPRKPTSPIKGAGLGD